METEDLYALFLQCDQKVSTDTRNIIPGSLFFALKGENFNGNEFAKEALTKGASCAVCDEGAGGENIIMVSDVLRSLQKLAQYHRTQSKAQVIAVTGSNGKTTTKELLHAIFSTSRNCLVTAGNLNNHIGVPLTLLRLREYHEILILEMGANHPGEIKLLCEMGTPDAGIITNIGKAHLEGFGGLQGVIHAKKELVDFLDDHEGIVFYNLNEPAIANLYTKSVRHISFGDNKIDVNFSGSLVQSFPQLEFYIHDNEQNLGLFKAQLYGKHNYQNALAACCIALYSGIHEEQIKKGLWNYIPANMRSEIILYKGCTVYLDAYNANPSSMRSAIEGFLEDPTEVKWIILGAMAELGTNTMEEHEALVKYVVDCSFNKIMLIGEDYAQTTLTNNMELFSNSNQAKEYLEKNWPKNAAILIKASRSAGLEKLIINQT
ncbi:MAG: UDP-N-acetylmuramoyl-tripeptide--D-alanyl-D-alanine ligase [Bacteroidota bacterium]|nr:UDP-N-acetylmuramoyl-tripeptide--D-alanyl-D-alanine ligase [Bacteroidota bacterium]